MKNLDKYEAFIATAPEIERKGKTVPYTSLNGYMFTLLNKEGEIGIRLPKGQQEEFKIKYDSTIFKSHGAVMKDYVLVPDSMFDNLELLKPLLIDNFNYVNSLPPKPTSKKKK
jgi:hypothetical protein